MKDAGCGNAKSGNVMRTRRRSSMMSMGPKKICRVRSVHLARTLQLIIEEGLTCTDSLHALINASLKQGDV